MTRQPELSNELRSNNVYRGVALIEAMPIFASINRSYPCFRQIDSTNGIIVAKGGVRDV